MEEEKAAAYYDELTRKGEGAARFKQGLGFSSTTTNDGAPIKGSALPSSSSFLSSFVKASSPTKISQLEKQAQLESIQNKLKKKPKDEQSRGSERNIKESSRRHRSRSRERDDRERHSWRRSRSRSRERYRERDRDTDRARRRRTRSRSSSPRRDRRSERMRSRSRSLSPRERRRSEKSTNWDEEKNAKREKLGKERNCGVEYSRLIEGYDRMTPAERVKARMKLQLDETAEKDANKGMGSGWERFEFNKDAPLDDEEIEAAEDDATLVKHIGQSFRFSAVETRREEQIKAAHDKAMFGAPALQPSVDTVSDPEIDNRKKEGSEADISMNLLSEKVLAKQKGSWRDRARKV